MEEAVIRVTAILAKADKLGLDRRQLARLAAQRRPPCPSTSCASPRGSWTFFLGGALAATLVALVLSGLSTSAGLARALILWNGGDIYTEKLYCDHPQSLRLKMASKRRNMFYKNKKQETTEIVWMPDSVVKAVRPPEDCSMCANLTRVDIVSGITPEQFENTYAYSGRPVVVTDATSNWTAPSEFSFSFFKELYTSSDLVSGLQAPWRAVAQDNCQFFPYETEFTSLWQVFNMSHQRATLQDGAKPWYIGWSNCDERVARVLREHYDRPYFLPETAENKNIDWIFMGSPGYGAKMHVDNVNNPSWQAQLVGSKRWTLQPPPECIYQCHTLQVTVEPGQIIVLDTNRWYHKTLIVSKGISITIGAEYD